MLRLGKTAAGVIGLVTLMVLVAPVIAQAGHRDHGRRHHERHRHHDDHGRHGRHRGRWLDHDLHGGRFAVPRHLGHGQHATYSPYYQQRVYHRGHRHHHSVYRYPVYTDHRRAYRSYAYCDGALYSRYRSGLHVALATPHFRVSYSGH